LSCLLRTIQSGGKKNPLSHTDDLHKVNGHHPLSHPVGEQPWLQQQNQKNSAEALKSRMWPLEVCTDDGLRIRAAGPAAFLRGIQHDIMSVWCKEGTAVWIENGSNGDRHPAKIKAITEGDNDVQIVWNSTGAIDTVPKSTVHQYCVDGGRSSRSRLPPQWLHAESDDQSATGGDKEEKKRGLSVTKRSHTLARKAAKLGKKESGKAARFVVESILESKMSEGRELFLVHWKGYGKDKDSWEPAGNIAMTGHIDMYKRECKCESKSLKDKVGTERVVIVEYEDGMQDTIDLAEETFRRPPEDGGGGANDFSLVEENAVIELLWPHAQRYYPCRIISCCSDV
jgi:hypothetical protein